MTAKPQFTVTMEITIKAYIIVQNVEIIVAVYSGRTHIIQEIQCP